MDKQYNISTVIVTFNRSALLKRCIDAVNSQTYKPAHVYIMDNASTDGTMDSVKNWGFYRTTIDGTQWHYILNNKNEGGAGGFYKGMKIAFEETNPDALWVMDDDGQPDKDCLKNLTEYLDRYDYLSPIVVAEEDEELMSFARMSKTEFLQQSKDGKTVKRYANPFNGILYSARLINTIGYPKKEMFIWGDEINYDLRAELAGFIPYTICNAIHIHPKDRQKWIVILKYIRTVEANSDWKLYCFIRNQIYNYSLQYKDSWKLWPKRLMLYVGYIYYFRKKKELSKKIKMLNDAFFSGIKGNFSGLSKYFNL